MHTAQKVGKCIIHRPHPSCRRSQLVAYANAGKCGNAGKCESAGECDNGVHGYSDQNAGDKGYVPHAHIEARLTVQG